VFPRFFKHFRDGSKSSTTYGKSYGKSRGDTFQRSHHVYTETATSATPWGNSSADHIMSKGDYVELSERGMNEAGFPIPEGARHGITKTVYIEAKHSPNDAV
jgi:hypothetical protein